ncbi:PEP/pyruvate-binding domain-containing protein [Polymorphospora rubra]|uniref:PEP/pyruvate-binding domain-containing protein n=1 Tax=Polymorphospora rubra TaxID=338584 RepID=UPI0033F5627F
MNLAVIDLAEVDAGMAHLVGGKAAGLARMIRAGERVPAGFCVTTTALSDGTVPVEEIRRAYERMGGGPVAVRSSATAEDLPDASFAGQHATVLSVTGLADLLDAIEVCRDSLDSERVVSYRAASGVGAAAMAVVVQRMVDAAVAGVLFTANPVTGSRAEMVVDAAPGPGAALVDGAVTADHYVLRDGGPAADQNVLPDASPAADQDVLPDGAPAAERGGCLTPQRLTELSAAGRRLRDLAGVPQDIEWAVDHDGVLWLLQSRPVTTLFPVPPDTGRPGPRVYLELGGQFQGVLRPFTPMGVAALRAVAASAGSAFGGSTRGDSTRVGGSGPDRESGSVVEIAGRLYFDLTDTVRRPGADRWLPKFVEADFGPRVRAVVEQVLADPRFAPDPGAARRGGGAGPLLRVAPRAVAGVVRALARPDAARDRAFRAVDEFRLASAAPAGLDTAAQRLRFVGDFGLPTRRLERMIWPLMAGILSGAAPAGLLKGIATEAEVRTVLGGMPHNITIEMDLALWAIAERAAEHRDLLLGTPATELAARYRAGTLPDIGLAGFLDRFGHRAAVEIDIGVPRWAEDPAPVLAAIANYLRTTDPDQAPDRRFARAARTATETLADLTRRVRRRRPVRGRIAIFLLRRARQLGGLREIGKFAGLYPLAEMRRQLLLVGAELAGQGLLKEAGDIMFLDLAEAGAAVHEQVDHRELVAVRKVAYDRELRRTHVPVALLSDGTDVEALRTPKAPDDDTLAGMAAAPGTVTGPARVVRDPADARVEPGEILVAPTTDPGWTPLFLTAGGLVTEIGAPLAHGPTVAREYGIPAVVCVRDATRLIRTGQIITVDGAAGTVVVNG